MSPLVYFLLICVIIYFLFTRALSALFGWILLRKFNVKVRFGRISFPFSLKDVNICKNGFTVQIDEICIRSSFFNSEVTKLLSINIKDIRINKDINKRIQTKKQAEKYVKIGKRKILDFRNKKVPPSIIKFAQFMAVHIHNISIVLMSNDFEPGWLLHATVNELHLELHNAKTLLVTAALNDAQVKILRQCSMKKQFTIKPNNLNKNRPCIVELSFGISLDAVIAQGPMSLERMQLTMNNTKTILHGGLYDFIRDAQKANEIIPTSPIRVLDTESLFHDEDNDDDDDELDSETFQRLLPILPKSFVLKIEDTTIVAVRENSSNDFSAKLQLLMVNGKFGIKEPDDEYKFPVLHTGIQFQLLEIDTKHEKLLYVEQYTMETKLEKDTLHIYSKLKAFQLVYNHLEIFNWFKNNFSSIGSSTSRSLSLGSEYRRMRFSKKRESFIESFMKSIVVKGCAELWNITMLFKLEEQTASFCVSHTKFLLEQYNEIRSSIYEHRIANLLLANRHWSTELMIESLWWSLGITTTKDSNNLKKYHSRGNPFFLGVSLIKLSSYGSATKLDISIHTLRTEFSQQLSDYLIQSMKCINHYRLLRKANKITFLKEKFKAKEKLTDYHSILVNAKVTDITFYFFNKFDTCILIGLGEISLARTQPISVFKLDGLQMALNTNPNSVGNLNKTDDFTNIFANIKVIRIEYMKHPKNLELPQITLYILDDNEAMWNPNLHMHIMTLSKEIISFKEQIKSKNITDDIVLNKQEETIKNINNNSKLKILFDLYAEGNTIFGIKVSERHSIQIFLENVYINCKEQTLISMENIFINIDGQHIFTFNNVDAQSVSELARLTAERKHFDFHLPTNRVWITIIGGFKVSFPYNHDFTEAVQNEFVSLIKWLKIIHNYKKKEFTQNSPLPSDLLIQIKEFLFEMSDDPFEVKLRDNYVLLLDEYNESLKRKQLFDQRISELCSERLIFPAGTLEELYSSLIKKNSEIYIQRSKKINEAGPTRTRLFAWIMNDLCINAMADPTIHGTENVTRMMKEIDQESPWPEEGLQFVTLWCRGVDISCSEWKFMLRDYPQPMFSVKTMHLFGNLCGAEQQAPRRAKRDVIIEIGHPFPNDMIERGMTALKFYHDFDCELGKCSYAFGPCWEPVMAQCNLSFEKISAPSRDPSPTLTFWDKTRLLFHGRLTMIVKQFTVLLHASLDPYNTTEEMELTWNNCCIFWTNSRIIFQGELNVSVRTASRYDDCRMLHFPNLKLTFKLNWICLANPNDHHSVIPCAPDKLPEYSSNQVHDSFRAFRSQNVNIWISFETKQPNGQKTDIDVPSIDLYGSTLRWFESLKLILSGVTRPTRRGPVFNNIRPRKKQLSRHYKKAHLQMSLHKFQVSYWISHSRNRGFELLGGRVSFSSEHTLTLNLIDDGLIHRPRSDWSTMYMNCELTDSEIWLKSNEKNDTSSENLSDTSEIPVFAKYYCLSVAKVSYGRDALLPKSDIEQLQKTPTHQLVVYDLKGAWTKHNRDVVFALFDSFMKAQRLKNNLSTEALKGFRKDGTTTTPLKSSNTSRRLHEQTKQSGSTSQQTQQSSTSGSSGQLNNSQQSSGSSNSATTSSSTQQTILTNNKSKNINQQLNNATNMLQQLISEAEHKSVVFSDDLSPQTREQQLQGLQACGDDDVTHNNWSISLINSQVLLRGCETSGYVILSAAKAEIIQRIHRPVWRDRSLVPKTTWIGNLECMQYYATVSGTQNEAQLEEIMWLTVDNIQEKDKDSTIINELPDLPDLVGSGGSVGGVVSQTVGAAGASLQQTVELQRIVSRCKCEFFYVSYGDTTIDPSTLIEVPPPPTEEIIVSPWEKQDDPVDAFTLMHHDLDVCTNSTQYAMILDIVNNLMLYVEPQRKQALEKLARMRFQLQLYSSEDQKRPIQHLQTQIRSLMSKLRLLEKDTHLIGRARIEEGDSDELRQEYEEVQLQIREYKEMLNTQSEELDMMLSCYKETQLSQLNKLQKICKDKRITIVRTNEICFKHAQWRLNSLDGQIGIADLILSNFLYTKKSKNDDSIEHLLELGYIRMNNLTQEIYKEVLCPTEIQKDMPIDHKRVLRVFCREKPPVGGISVKEHFEINVVPITIAITKRFYNIMLKFCFPDRLGSESGTDDIDDTNGSTSSLRTSSSMGGSSTSGSKKNLNKQKKKESKDSEFYVKIEKDDVEKMKERAEKNKLFIYIKIPEVPVRVTYKGNKEKNFEDITDFSLVIPTLEYHNVTWTWLDLLLAMKSDSRRVILSQAIKQKLQIHRHKPLSSVGEKASPQEEDKAKMLFGNRHGAENKSQRKGIIKISKS